MGCNFKVDLLKYQLSGGLRTSTSSGTGLASLGVQPATVSCFRINIVCATKVAIPHQRTSYVTVAVRPVAPPTCSMSAHDDLGYFYGLTETMLLFDFETFGLTC